MPTVRRGQWLYTVAMVAIHRAVPNAAIRPPQSSERLCARHPAMTLIAIPTITRRPVKKTTPIAPKSCAR